MRSRENNQKAIDFTVVLERNVFSQLTMDSLMGYSVLSGKIQLDRQDTTLVTPISWAVSRTLLLILRLSLCKGGSCLRYRVTGAPHSKSTYDLTRKYRFSFMCR